MLHRDEFHGITLDFGTLGRASAVPTPKRSSFLLMDATHCSKDFFPGLRRSFQASWRVDIPTSRDRRNSAP